MTYLGFVECLVMTVSCPSLWCGKSCGLKPNVAAPMGCSGYIAVLLMLEDASGCLSVAASTVPPCARDWHLAPPLPPARAIWPATSGKRPRASRDLFHLYSPELRIPSLCGRKKVAICRQLETPWTCLYPQDGLTLSCVGHIQSRPALSLARIHPVVLMRTIPYACP